MKDLIDSIRAQIHQRLNSPLFGAFVISWLAWNHRYLFILFSELPVQERFALAERLLYSDPVWLWGRNLVFPALTSLSFILIYPYPSRWLYSYWHKREIELKKRRDEIEGATLLTETESRQIKQEAFEEREKLRSTIQQLNADRDTYRRGKGRWITLDEDAEIKGKLELADKIVPAPALERPLWEGLSKGDLRIVSAIMTAMVRANETTISADQITSLFGGLKLRGQYAIDLMLETNLLQKTSGGYLLTPEGRKFAMRQLSEN